jgi:alkylation response protein AidB-like acyl-CoA dehydrogenase
MMYANEAQKEQWLRPLAQGEMLGAFALTEPHTGSDAAALRTTATRVSDNAGDHYVINGTKQFITSGKNGDVAIVMAVTDKAAGKKGISAFWVPTNTPGYIVAGIEHKMGQHSSDTAQIVFDNCRVPAENLIGEEGQGYKIALSGLEGGRIGIASQSVGMARAAFEAALAYAKERESFGTPIFDHQAVQFRLAEMAMQIEAARQLILHAASMKDAGVPCLKEAAMAKLFASEMAERVVSSAMQVFGGYGYVSDFPVERIYRDVRVCQIYEGTSDIQKILIARAL